MYSSKSSELISRLQRELYAKRKIQLFKPRIDDRFHKTKVVSHSGLSMDALPVGSAREILDLVWHDTTTVGIDECQFFDEALLAVVGELADSGVRVICAGLDQDYRGKPFGIVPQLMAIAEYVTKQLAVCTVCGNPANRTQRITESDQLILVGAQEYEARCRRCHKP